MPARGVSKGGEPGKTSTVFVGNIPYDATEDDVRGHLSQGGKVESFRMVFDKETLQPKGYGFCDFADPDTAITAIKILSEKECNGRLLRLDLADNDQSRGAPARAAAKAGSGTLALVGPEAPSRPRQPQAPPAPIKTSGTTAGSGVVTPSTVDPAAAAAAALEDPNVPADTIMASVAAHTDIVQTVASMPQAHLQLCLGTMQELAKAAPERARAVLLEHPQLSHALLHAQFLLGLSLDQTMPPDLTETAELRAEAVQRAMSNSKTLAGPRRGAVPPARNVNASAPYPPNVIIPARPILPGGLGPPGMRRGITIDPGFIPDNWQKSENGRPIFEVEGGIVFMHERKKKTGELRFCNKEMKFKPDRAHYCSAMRRNVLRMDHYCPWLANCVGYHNHKFFFLFLFYTLIATGTLDVGVIRALHCCMHSAGHTFMMGQGAVISTLLTVLLGPFFGFHCWLMKHNMTTIEYCEKRRDNDESRMSHYDIGVYRNIQCVLGDNWMLWLLPISGPSGDGLLLGDALRSCTARLAVSYFILQLVGLRNPL
ncbi:PFA3 [Symbiodinium sp. KB8]|nr:PFA3 [Symbiodinium sp. KB8]